MAVKENKREIIVVPLSYLEYYHNEAVNNPFYSTPRYISKQKEILTKLRIKGGIGEDEEVAIKINDMKYFQLK